MLSRGGFAMSFGKVVLLVLAVLTMPCAALAQTAVYAEFSASNLQGGPQGNYLYGAQAGVLVDGPTLFHHILLQADIQGRFVHVNGEALNSVLVGPRISIAPKHVFGLEPFAEFNVGFGRYNDGSNNSTTDGLFSTQGGLTKQITPHIDALVDYSYAFYGYNFGIYQPQTYSAGVMYHFTKR
jgi:hypothetical protein